MDGQRRIHQSLRRSLGRIGFGFVSRGIARQWYVAARVFGVAFLVGAVLLGLMRGGHLENQTAGLARVLGLAASDIEIAGLSHHAPQTVLQVLGVSQGSSLIGFDPLEAQRTLAAESWIESAEIQRVFPNQLKIRIVERVPFAIWQNLNAAFVIDRNGRILEGVDLTHLKHLLVVTGAGANQAAVDLIDKMQTWPDLALKLYGASYVGSRRWTLYLDNGLKIALPEGDVSEALALVQDLDVREQVLSKAIAQIDLRQRDKIIITQLPIIEDADHLLTGSLNGQKND